MTRTFIAPSSGLRRDWEDHFLTAGGGCPFRRGGGTLPSRIPDMNQECPHRAFGHRERNRHGAAHTSLTLPETDRRRYHRTLRRGSVLSLARKILAGGGMRP